MAFTWTPISVGDKVDNSHYNEIKTNIDTIISNLGITAYNWTRFPKNDGDMIDDQDTLELRDAADYAHDNNVCASDNSTNYSSVDNSDLGSDLSTNNSGFCGTYNANVDNNQHATVKSVADAGYDSSYDGGVYSNNLASELHTFSI